MTWRIKRIVFSLAILTLVALAASANWVDRLHS